MKNKIHANIDCYSPRKSLTLYLEIFCPFGAMQRTRPAPSSSKAPLFKDLNVQYTEERNRDDGYWSSTSSDESSSGLAPPARAEKLTSRSRPVSDFRLDTKEKARQEWLWATGQLGVEPEVVRAPKPVATELKVAKPALIERTAEPISVNPQLTKEEESVISTPSPVTPLPPPVESEAPLAPKSSAGVTSAEAVAQVPEVKNSTPTLPVEEDRFHSLAYLEKVEYEAAQAKWIESNFERQFNAEHEIQEARRRAAERFYRQQNASSFLGADASGGDHLPAHTTGAALNHFSHQSDEVARSLSRQRMFMRCAEGLEELVQSDAFVDRVQRFLKKHHRSLLSTKMMRESGEYCHEDHAVFRAYVTEMEGCIMRALHEGAAQYHKAERRRKARTLSSTRRQTDGYTGVQMVTAGGVGVVVRLEESSESEDELEPQNGTSNDFIEFDEEEFFDFLFSTNADEDGAGQGRGDALSFEAWEALLSVLHFNSFIDLVDEYVAAEYGLDDMEAREDSKAARKRGLPSSSAYGNSTPPPSPPEATKREDFTPTRQPQHTATACTPSPPKNLSGSASGSGAAIRKLMPSVNSRVFAGSVSGTVKKEPVGEGLSRSHDVYPSRAPGSAPQPGRSGSRPTKK